MFQRLILTLFLKNLARATVVLLVFAGAVAISVNVDSPLDLTPLVVTKICLSLVDSALPLALLLASLFTAGNMTHNGELMALHTVGWSLLRITRPLMVTALVALVFSGILRIVGWSITKEPLAVTAAAKSTDFYARIAEPFACLLMTATGILLTTSPMRKSRYSGFGWALLIFYLYHLATNTAVSLGRIGELPPLLAGAGINLIFCGVLVVAWRRAKR